jgi:hypothetical protein
VLLSAKAHNGHVPGAYLPAAEQTDRSAARHMVAPLAGGNSNDTEIKSK